MSSWPSKICVFGVWPIAMNTPCTGRSCVASVFVDLHAHAGHAGSVAQHFVERVVPQHAHVAAAFGLRHQAVDEDRLGAKLVAAMHDGDLLRDVRQVQRLLDGRVAAADDDDVLALVEEAVAGRAGGHALAHERFFRRQSEVARRRAGGDDQRVARVLAACRRCRRNGRSPSFTVWMWSKTSSVAKRSACFWKRAIRSGPMDAVGVRRPVVDVGRRHQLSALRQTGDQHRRKVGARGVYCGACSRPGRSPG